jgi:23S rRNA (pseudouridine1915-N3)-methyltransferase
MKIKLLCIGKTNFKFAEDGMHLYQSRIKHFVDIEPVFIPDIKNTKNMPVDEIKKKEAVLLIKNIGTSDFICLLDENGSSMGSEGFADFLQKKVEQNIKQLTFVVGGAYGFSSEIYARADFKLSLSKMTFSHQIIRLFFLEQLYRAYTIIKGLPYHNQ